MKAAIESTSKTTAFVFTTSQVEVVRDAIMETVNGCVTRAAGMTNVRLADALVARSYQLSHLRAALDVQLEGTKGNGADATAKITVELSNNEVESVIWVMCRASLDIDASVQRFQKMNADVSELTAKQKLITEVSDVLEAANLCHWEQSTCGRALAVVPSSMLVKPAADAQIRVPIASTTTSNVVQLPQREPGFVRRVAQAMDDVATKAAIGVRMMV